MAAWDNDPIVSPKKSPWESDPVVGKAPAWHADPVVSTAREAKQSSWFDGLANHQPKPMEAAGSVNPITNLWEGEKAAISSAFSKLNPFSAERRQETIEAGKKPFFSMPSGLGRTGSALYDLASAHPAVAAPTAIAQSVGNLAQKGASAAFPNQKIVRSGDVQTALMGMGTKATHMLPDNMVVGEAGAHPVSGQPLPVTHADQVAAISDDFHRVKNGKVDDNLEAKQKVHKYMTDHPTLDDPLTPMTHQEGQAILSAHVEGDPEAEAKMTPHLRKIENEHIKPLLEEAEENHKWLKKNKALESDQVQQGNYIRRWAEGKNRTWEYADDLENPLPIGQSLTNFWREFKSPSALDKHAKTTPASEHSRVYFAAQNERTGERRVVYKKDDEFRNVSDNQPINAIEDKIVPAFTREIEAQTSQRYSKNALADMLDTVMEQRAVMREQKMLNSLKGSAWFQANSLVADPKKPPTPEKAKLAADEGWKSTKHGQFKEMVLHPHLAEVLDDAARGKTVFESAAIANRLMVGTLFWSPVVHALNVWGHAFVSRGISNFTVPGQARAFKAGVEALHQVMTQGPEFRKFLREGGALLSGSLDNHEMHTQMIKMMGESIKKDKFFGVITGLKNTKQLIPLLYKASSKTLWTIGDVLMMQLYKENMAKGMTTRQAIREVERHVPNYRIPPKVMGSRVISLAMQSPELGQFNRYHYGVFKAYNSIATDLVGRGAKGTIEEQGNALGQLIATGFLAGVIYPGLNEAVRWLSSNKNAHEIAFGPLAPLNAMGLVPTGEKRGDISALARGAFMFAPTVGILAMAGFNRDMFTGQNVRTRSLSQGYVQSTARQMGQITEKLLQMGVAPYQVGAQEWRDSVSGKSIPASIGKALISQGAGLKLPDKKPFDPLKGGWRKTGENNETMYRMRRKGARGPVEYFAGNPEKHIKGAWSDIVGVIKHKNPKPGMGGPQ